MADRIPAAHPDESREGNSLIWFHIFVFFSKRGLNYFKPIHHGAASATLPNPSLLILSFISRKLRATKPIFDVRQMPSVSHQIITILEQELRTPNLDMLIRLTSALGVDLEKITARARKRIESKNALRRR